MTNKFASTAAWPEVWTVDWTSLEGAYGPSDGSGDTSECADVATILEALRARRYEGDEIEEALALLFGQLEHQGTLYPVTARALPFLFQIRDEAVGDPDRRDEAEAIADFVLLCALSADPEADSNADAVLRTLLAEERRLAAWTHEPLRAKAIAIMLCVPGLDTRVLGGDAALALDPREVLVVFLRGGVLRGRVGRFGSASAASLLEKRGDRNADKLEALGEALADGRSLDALRDRFSPAAR
jgi:hypothetical protein